MKEFQDKTIHLLQLTKAAVYSFVFCVRLQCIQERPDDLEGNGFVIDFKK
jgi:hypothetical protein